MTDLKQLSGDPAQANDLIAEDVVLSRLKFAAIRFAGPASLSDEDRQAVAGAVSASRTVTPGFELVGERATGDVLYMLADGWACRYKTSRDGQRQMPTILLPGDICNLDALLFNTVDYTVRTLTPATVLTVSKSRLLALVESHPGIARAVLWMTMVENATLSQGILALGRMTARQRLAHLVCELATRLDAGGGRHVTYTLPLTQEQLADALGLTSVHVNRTLQSLRADGLIVTWGRSVTIPDMAALAAVAEFDPAYLHR